MVFQRAHVDESGWGQAEGPPTSAGGVFIATAALPPVAVAVLPPHGRCSIVHVAAAVLPPAAALLWTCISVKNDNSHQDSAVEGARRASFLD